jgi:hypothetical protein
MFSPPLFFFRRQDRIAVVQCFPPLFSSSEDKIELLWCPLFSSSEDKIELLWCPLFSSSEDKIELLWCARGLALSRLQVLTSSPPALNSHTKVLCVLLLSWVQSCTSVVGNAVGIAVGAAVGCCCSHGYSLVRVLWVTQLVLLSVLQWVLCRGTVSCSTVRRCIRNRVNQVNIPIRA